jgi:hypothetical protein
MSWKEKTLKHNHNCVHHKEVASFWPLVLIFDILDGFKTMIRDG